MILDESRIHSDGKIASVGVWKRASRVRSYRSMTFIRSFSEHSFCIRA